MSVCSSAAWGDTWGCLGLGPPAAKGQSQPLLIMAHAQAALEISTILNTWVPKEMSPCPTADLEAHRKEMLNFTSWYKSKCGEAVHESSAKEGSLWSVKAQ